MVSGKTVKLDYVNNKWTYSTSITNAKDESRSCAFYQVTADSSIGDAAKVMLRALALLPDSDVTTDVYEGDYMWWNNGVAERACIAGAAGAAVRTLVCSTSTATPAAMRTRTSASVPLISRKSGNLAI